MSYDSRQPLVCCEHKELGRQLGVLVGEKFLHRGMDQGMAECEYETITANTRTFGGPVLLEWVPRQQRDMTQTILDDIDEVVKELLQHRDRLALELEKLGPTPRSSLFE